MKFKIGDKVKFLNEPGGGVVSKIISTSMVTVSIEEGFDIPVLTSELVKIDTGSHSGEMFKEEFNVEVKQEMTEPESNDFDERVSRIDKKRNRGISEKGIYLVYQPHDQQWLVTGMLDVYLVNNTGIDILFSIFLKQPDKDDFEGIDYGSIQPYSKYHLETINHDHIRQWINGIVQVMFHIESTVQVVSPISSDFNLKSSRFANTSQYVETSFMEGKSFVLKLADKPILKAKEVPEATEVIEQKAQQQKAEQLIDKYMTSRDEAVVDLHIGQVTNDLTDLSPHDMLQVQLDHFQRCLDSAIENRLRKVTFIHGVGNGTLREAIVEKMKEYEKLEHQSASLSKFGVGAVDILIYEKY